MIDVPSLPTDSLYKFLALSGVFIMAFSLYTYARFYTLTKSKAFELEAGVEELDAEVSFFERQVHPEQSDLLKTRIKHQRSKVLLKELIWYRKQLIVIGLLTSIFASLGGFMAFQGFNLWYWKIQVHQDRLTELKVDELEKSL
ncbi:hypothetical protein [Vibrio vulnificus]|uniref:hypothetical protein n=1 Tax=Vibrio vulnificus TaxID=672 RepID=UPI0028A4D334|nr:hypothetical protein [Vibrio vulnificus]HDY8058006.1 hypothetical protein [Vibrio vulnificus]